MSDFERKHLSSRQYTEAEIIEWMFGSQPWNFDFQLKTKAKDYKFEDTMPIYLSLPRVVWNAIYAIAENTDETIGKTASRLMTEKVAGIISEMPVSSGSSEFEQFQKYFNQGRKIGGLLKTLQTTLKKVQKANKTK